MMGRLKRPGLLICMLAAVGLLAASAAASPVAFRCSPTPTDGFGPFGRGAPPVRAKIGAGHVLTGVVLSALDCKPLRGAQVQLWQSNAKGRYTPGLSATVITDRAGRFRFQGPYPASYEGRPPHIHLRVLADGHLPLLARYEPAQGARRGNLRLVLEPEAL
jgi:protocatechuate 3,4-dioxygenase beta subunit